MTHAQPPHSLAGTRLLITGAAGGVGLATARLCAGLGAELILTDLHISPALQSLADSLPHVRAVQACDVSQRLQVEALVNAHPEISALIDTAGICPYDDDWLAPDWNETAFMKVMQVNVLGPMNWARALLPGMLERGYGRMAFCGSVAGWMGGLRAGAHYAASKGGVHALVRWLAQRGTPRNVMINGVAPGVIDTPMTAGHGYQSDTQPMKRFGQPEEIAHVLSFLVSPGASFMGGCIVDANGGILMR
ncbi:MAG: SDR family oxidoreductase [Limnohabitans sp.]|jgi:NAD(P)-dependent dehydrogenase (short-subunit alcohol dehydrogenase family)|nr:SDR family oxidoreductase [Limnohabitans sp.]